ncbi:ectoine/hydroxyectoine ABC transporter substrate-binding protein EhuB [Bordetella genomosp. 9]|uniref:ectoine/hydroxyectoine ABC transporter substrate-binding protein EhuB n=1 Tax=Bordetella genomosp. 9 TaxID=1416803 RepID=UPI000A28FD53|nr:ectoine/hydroxyectoine ABC transporter substrate-binding protein EhuB [Bordetella genomosp. 9]ARP89405.1 ectoine/hydroxyectoine ABC transporter substrate-binding protein EhuB [Bordetella genomosp. 9]
MMHHTKKNWLGRFLALGVAACAAAFAPAAGAASTKDAILESGTLTIGIHNRAPWGFRDADGKAAGFHADLVREAFAPLGVKNINFVITEFGALIPGLTARRFDMVASGLAITPPRCQVVIFSEPDLAVGDGLIVAKGNPLKLRSYADIAANPKVRLAGGRGTLNSKNAQDAGVPASQMVFLDSPQSQLSALIAGRVDAVTLSAPSVVSLLQDPNVKGVERARPFQGLIRNGVPAAMYTGIAFRKEDEDLRDLFNKQLAKLKADGTVSKLMERYGFTPDDAPPSAVTTARVCAGEY